MNKEKVIRYVLAGVFLLAGILKIEAPERTADVIVFFDLLSYSSAVAFVYLAAIVEMILSVLLVFRVNTRMTGILIVALCTFFVGLSLLGWLNNWDIACGCFGRFSFGRFDGAMVIRNSILLILAAGWVRLNHKREAIMA